MLSVFGTVISTLSTGLMVHHASKYSKEVTFPLLDSLVFGALSSSIDPVGVLGVLTSLRLDQTDTIFSLSLESPSSTTSFKRSSIALMVARQTQTRRSTRFSVLWWPF